MFETQGINTNLNWLAGYVPSTVWMDAPNIRKSKGGVFQLGLSNFILKSCGS